MAITALTNFSTKTANYTLVASDDVVQFNCSSGSLTATLLDATTVTVGKKYEVRRAADATSANTLTVNTTSSQTIDGRASGSIKLSPSDYAVVVSDGVNWQVVILQETVAAKYFASANGTANSSTPVNFDSKVYDTHGAVTPGASWKFTAPVSGKYAIKMFLNNSSSPAGGLTIPLYKNGALYETLGGTSTAFPIMNLSTTIPLIAGDTFDIRSASSSYPWSGGALNAGGCWIAIERIGN